jgi:hypothetical protein
MNRLFGGLFIAVLACKLTCTYGPDSGGANTYYWLDTEFDQCGKPELGCVPEGNISEKCQESELGTKKDGVCERSSR